MNAGRWPTRPEAEAVLFEFTQSEALRRHGRAVEEAMRAYARRFGVSDTAEVERWGIVGLLHDFDYEQNPTDDTHLHVGGRVLRERGYGEELVETIQSHADYMKIPRDTPMKKAIYACDELVGFIGACVKVRPTKKLEDLPVSSVVKRLKDKAFARSVDRSTIYGGAEALGVPLEEHIAFHDRGLEAHRGRDRALRPRVSRSGARGGCSSGWGMVAAAARETGARSPGDGKSFPCAGFEAPSARHPRLLGTARQ